MSHYLTFTLLILLAWSAGCSESLSPGFRAVYEMQAPNGEVGSYEWEWGPLVTGISKSLEPTELRVVTLNISTETSAESAIFYLDPVSNRDIAIQTPCEDELCARTTLEWTSGPSSLSFFGSPILPFVRLDETSQMASVGGSTSREFTRSGSTIEIGPSASQRRTAFLCNSLDDKITYTSGNPLVTSCHRTGSPAVSFSLSEVTGAVPYATEISESQLEAPRLTEALSVQGPLPPEATAVPRGWNFSFRAAYNQARESNSAFAEWASKSNGLHLTHGSFKGLSEATTAGGIAERIESVELTLVNREGEGRELTVREITGSILGGVPTKRHDVEIREVTGAEGHSPPARASSLGAIMEVVEKRVQMEVTNFVILDDSRPSEDVAWWTAYLQLSNPECPQCSPAQITIDLNRGAALSFHGPPQVLETMKER